MKLKNPLLVVTDMDRSVAFYKKVFGLHVIMDFGANKTLTGGLSLQTIETYKAFIGTSEISFGGNDFEIYFEEDDFDAFARRLQACDIAQKNGNFNRKLPLFFFAKKARDSGFYHINGKRGMHL